MKHKQLLMIGLVVISSALTGGVVAFQSREIINSASSSTPDPPELSQTPSVLPTEVNTPTIVSIPELAVDLYLPVRRDVRLMVTSDLNAAYGSTDYDPEVDRAIALLPYWQPDLVIGAGDMIAGQDPRLSAERLRAMWQAFDIHFAQPLREAQLPYGFTVGNHDASGARSVRGDFLFAVERAETSKYWNDPEHDPGLTFVDRGDFPFYYTFEFQNIFFMTWDASSNWIPPEQLGWAEQQLASERAQSARLRIVLGHLPLYAVAVGRNELGEVLTDADTKRQLLEQYNVHTYISGHHHSYYPAHKGRLQLLHSGILGSGPRPLVDSPLPPRKTLTLIDIDFQTLETFYTTYNMQTLDLIDQGELPRLITGVNGVILRRDVEWDSLTPDELAKCQQQLGDLCRF